MTLKNDISWMIGGPQGTGVDSSATLFARAMSVAGYWVYGKREYHSNIKGEHSYFHLRVNTEPVRSIIDPVHLLATFEDSTASIHGHEIVADGALIYDPKVTKPEHLEIEKSVKLYPIEFDAIINQMAEETGQHPAKLAIVKNTIAVAASMALLGVSLDAMEGALKGLFTGRRAKLVDMNMSAAKKAYAAMEALGNLESFAYRMAAVTKMPEKNSRLVMNGAAACGLGKLKAGCRMQTYYSITPSVDECIFLENHPEFGALVVQLEDELAAVNMVNGSALTGMRASTATSGPGLSLMSEGIGWAGINEVPSVVFNYQRGGPSTGLPTRSEQAELLFAIHAGHGEFPRIVMAPGDQHECFEDGFYSFNYAERYQTPVIVLVDKALANCTQTIDRFDEESLVIDRGDIVKPDFEWPGENATPEDALKAIAKFKRFAEAESGISPRVLPGTIGKLFWMTGDEHDEYGHISEEPENRIMMHEKRFRKLDAALKGIPQDHQYKLIGPETADVTLVAWGSTKGAIEDALKVLEAKGIKANFLHIRLMHPFPTEAVTKILSRAKTIINIESNFTAQLAQLIKLRTGIDIPHVVLKYTGRPVSETEVVDAVLEVTQKKTGKVVLTCGH
ncbi:MAG: 2-oxoacid:acceptor oxidoreductase subunit alpha [Vampirovibrionales bacterium]|nr:2-oxoacid:acceptor oxidoreductase subunit alpha [Vampirovibrionales bacterium]